MEAIAELVAALVGAIAQALVAMLEALATLLALVAEFLFLALTRNRANYPIGMYGSSRLNCSSTRHYSDLWLSCVRPAPIASQAQLTTSLQRALFAPQQRKLAAN